MSNKITNDESFQSFLGKYISLTQNGVKKKYFVSEINKNTFLSNVSILQGSNGTDFSFTSAGLTQRCNSCDFPCISAIPVIELIFPGKQTARDIADQAFLLQKNYIDEIHCPILNNYKTATIYTSVLSADFNIVWLIPSNRTDILINTDDVFVNTNTNSTTSFSAFFFDPAYYNINGLNELKIDHVYADNPVTSPPTYPGYNSSWFWCDFYDEGLADAPFYTSRVLYKKIVQDNNGTNYLSCLPWLQYELTPTAWADETGPLSFGDYVTPYPPSLQTDYQQVSCIFLDLNPCNPPSVNFYQYDTTKYYLDTISYRSYADDYSAPYYPYPLLKKVKVYTSCDMTTASYIYVGRDTAKRDSGVNYTQTLYYSDVSGNIINSGSFYYSPSELYEYNVVNGIIDSSALCE